MPGNPSDDAPAAEPSIDRSGEATTSVASDDGATPVSDSEASSASDSEASPASGSVDEAVQRRLREAYLNDEERVLVVTAVRSAGSRVVVEFRPPHGGQTHVERFPAPRDGSLAESEAFLAFLDAAGVSPLDVDELVGARIPATYDPDDGWRLDEAYVGQRDDEAVAGAGGLRARWERSVEWLWAYRYWLVALALVGGELLFVAVIIVLFG
jgi:hypothetical protein